MTASILRAGLLALLVGTLAMASAAEAHDARVASLLEQMTLDEKISMLHANEKFYAGGVERLGIPRILMSDGPHGVRGDVVPHSWESANRPEDSCTYLPVGTVLASTWNPELGTRFGQTLGAEARARGKDVILGPGINVIRTPINGRNFEYMSEDPHLIASMAVPVIRGIQENDIAACVKHYLANNQELDRFHVSVDMPDRAMREIYLPGFKAALLEGESHTLMCAYNRFRGVPCSQSPILGKQILRDEWGSDAVFITDWHIHGIETVAAAMNGLDIEMGSPLPYSSYAFADSLRAAVREGTVPERVIDEKVTRILGMMFETKMLGDESRSTGAFNTPEHQQAALDIAREGIILLKNDGLLPIPLETLKRVVVIGPNADAKHSLGGGSSQVPALYEITPLEGLRQALPEGCELQYFRGVTEQPRGRVTPMPASALISADPGSGVPAWRGEYYPNLEFEGKPVVRYDSTVDFDLGDRGGLTGIERTNFSVRWTGTISVPVSGNYTFRLGSDDGTRLYVDGERVIDHWWDHAYEVREASLQLTAGDRHELVIEYYQAGGDGAVQLGWILPERPDRGPGSEQTEMMNAVRRADAVFYFGGLDKSHDRESADRTSMTLPYGQDELIAELLEVRPDTVIGMVAGSVIEMPWLGDARALLWMGYAGMEGGTAAAEIIGGKVNPSGKLPYTMPKRLEDTPAHSIGEYASGEVYYNEGVFVGYRWAQEHGIEPNFAFGHGLSYTTFKISSLRSPGRVRAGEACRVEAFVTNTGDRAGSEVVQLYLSDIEASVERPKYELKGFVKVYLEPGETRAISFELNERDFAFWDESANRWHVEPGEFEVTLGTSSVDLHLTSTLVVVGSNSR
ncbi:MAG: glycoside hydrolase family 3 C-terminal domain-containing protein [Planctomycetota bacterium]